MTSIIPIHYEIKIEPNFQDFTFGGTTIIHLNASQSSSKVVLNAAELNITSCTLLTSTSKDSCKITNNYENEEVEINLPNQMIGEFKLEFVYTGEINNKLRGLYKTRYRVGNEMHAGAITQFETEDARRMFPCFDEPGLKATFDLQVVVEEENFTAVANTPIKSEQKLQSGKRIITFERTPKMSTYLLFLGVAEFEMIEDKLENIQVRVLTHPGLKQYAQPALDFGKKSLDYSQKYFKVPYPLVKLDLLGTPDFAAGAMENWGAISFRENRLLIFPNSTSKLEVDDVKNVIAHEIAHQWFGNLVSPSIWKYIWLNESFADFFANKVIDYYNPELKVWERNLWSSTSIALEADGYIETVPIELEGQKEASYTVKSVPIIYDKGGAILRMVESYVGKDMFQKGLQNYMNEFAYGVAESDDLWMALEKTSGKPISKLMTTWVKQPGYPLISVKRNGSKLTFSQERFTFSGKTDDTTWIVPISILLFSKDNEPIRKDFLLEKKEDTFDTGLLFDSFKINVENGGFYVTQYPTDNLQTLVSNYKNQLPSIEVYNLVIDCYYMLVSRKVTLDYYLSFIDNFRSPKYSMATKAISDSLNFLNKIAEGEVKAKIQEYGVKYHEEMLSKIGYIPSDDESESYDVSTLRNSLLRYASNLTSEKALNFALAEFEKLNRSETVSADILDAVLSITAKETNDLDWFVENFDNAQNEVEIINLGNAFGEFSGDALEKVLDEILFTKIPMRNQSRVIYRLCSNPHAVPKLWKFFIANLDNIGKMDNLAQGRVIRDLVSCCPDEETKKDMEKFFEEYNKTNPLAKPSTEKAFETVELRFKLREHLKK